MVVLHTKESRPPLNRLRSHKRYEAIKITNVEQRSPREWSTRERACCLCGPRSVTSCAREQNLPPVFIRHGRATSFPYPERNRYEDGERLWEDTRVPTAVVAPVIVIRPRRDRFSIRQCRQISRIPRRHANHTDRVTPGQRTR